MKIAAFVLIGLMSQTVFAGEPYFNLYLGLIDGRARETIALSRLAQRKDLSTETVTCVGELKSRLLASPKFRSIRHLVKEVAFSDTWAPLPERPFGIDTWQKTDFWSRKPKANALSMHFMFAGAECGRITIKKIDQEIDAWLAQYAVDTAAKIKAIEKLNESDTEKAQSEAKRKTVESAPADPRAGRTDEVRRRIHATEADGGVDTGLIR